MSAEENKDLVRRVIDRLNSGETLGNLDLFSPEHTIYGPEGSTEAGDTPPYFLNVEDQIAEGDKVVTRWTLHIGSGGEDAESRAVGNQVIVASGITIDRVSGGKIEETWTSWEEPIDVPQEAAGALDEFSALYWPKPPRPKRRSG